MDRENDLRETQDIHHLKLFEQIKVVALLCFVTGNYFRQTRMELPLEMKNWNLKLDENVGQS